MTLPYSAINLSELRLCLPILYFSVQIFQIHKIIRVWTMLCRGQVCVEGASAAAAAYTDSTAQCRPGQQCPVHSAVSALSRL